MERRIKTLIKLREARRALSKLTELDFDDVEAVKRRDIIKRRIRMMH